MKKELLFILCSILLFCSFTENNEIQEEPLTIVATITMKPEFKAEILNAVKTVVDATRKEPGNIFYDVFEDVKNPLKLTFIETWKSQSAIDSHNNSAHFKAFVKAVEGKATLEASVLKQKF
ncbi:MAG: antibiotic biosynthesis monooxygenase [Dysgonamonadaceae bacterium]|jgi:quinol monooxygenase YgiN|nr:antibiotic biosynthesis monooxygenase [Dysgonamonadaceae bacterium]